MKERPDLNILSKEIYEANKAKGWHDKEYSNEHYLCLVISELMDAVEADRKGKRCETETLMAFKNNDAIFMTSAFDLMIKDSVEDELADAVIRLLDLAGVRGYELKLEEANKWNTPNGTFSELVFYTSKIIIDFIHVRYENKGKHISYCLECIEAICQRLSIDLWLHVDLKLKYNLTRPYKHGKEY